MQHVTTTVYLMASSVTLFRNWNGISNLQRASNLASFDLQRTAVRKNVLANPSCLRLSNISVKLGLYCGKKL